MTTEQVSDWLQIPEKTLRQWRYKRVGPDFVRLGKHVRYHPADVLEYLDNSAGQQAA